MNKEKLLQLIIKDVKGLNGFVDVIDRSGKEYVKGWSDIDLSLIFEKIDYELLTNLRRTFKRWEKYGQKLDIFILTPEDNPTLSFHFHGGYQLTYLEKLKKARAVFKKYPLKGFFRYPPSILKIDCLRTMALKIQEIRQTVLTGRFRFRAKSLCTKAREVMHILKKAKTISEMASKIIKFANRRTPKDIIKFINSYNKIRMSWNSIKNNTKELTKIEQKTIDYVERIYQRILKEYFSTSTSK
jgi:hypothetical protein